VADALAALVCHGTLTRFPGLRIASMENGGHWLVPLVADLRRVHKKMPQEFAEEPGETIKRCFYLNPFWEEDFHSFRDVLPVDHLLFGSDYPHPEGLADPVSFVNDLVGFSDDEILGIMGDNMAAFIG
jgi:predicted TIM-barrel fold metal-dependent hydrolase